MPHMNGIPSILANGAPVSSPQSRGLSLDTGAPVFSSPTKSPVGLAFSLSPNYKSPCAVLPPGVILVDAANTDAVAEYTNGASDVLVVDVRPFNLYSILRLRSAHNICIPSTLLRRPRYDVSHVINSAALPTVTKKRLLAFTPTKVLVYDAASTADHASLSLCQTVNKFLAHDCFEVAFLEGGLNTVDALLVDHTIALPMRSPVSPQTPKTAFMPSSDVLKSSDRLLLSTESQEPASFLSGFSLPSATASNQKMLLSIKKTLPRLDTTADYTHTLRLPNGFVDKMDKLPKWLQFLAKDYGTADYNKNIIAELSEKFNQLEKSEQLRLSMAIDNFDKSSRSTGKLPSHLHDSLNGHCTPLTLCPYCDEITYTIPKGIEYGHKNRYNNIWPYEHSRVCLVSSPCSTVKETADDYFNANYIHYDKLSRTKYIATQNPMDSTNEDFWNTVWYHGVKGIVCLNNPLIISPQTYYDSNVYFGKSDIGIKIVSTEKLEGFTVREIEMNKHAIKKTIYHFAYSDWPDFGTPDNFHTVFNLRRLKTEKVGHLETQMPSPAKIPQVWDLLVHCSAGCGRTGCFITLDMVLDCFENASDGSLVAWGGVDLVYKSVQFQRQQRVSMVQNLEQFVYCYESVLNYVVEYLM